MDKEIDQLLNYDGIAEAEKLTGNRWDQSDATIGLGMALTSNKNKQLNKLLQETDDTLFSNKKEDYFRKLSAFGFDLVFTEPFDNDGVKEDCGVLFHSEHSILLWFDTYWGNINNATVYYNWKPNDNNLSIGSDLTSSGCFIENTDERIWSGYHDGREAVKRKINRLLENGVFIDNWVECAFSWLLNYTEFKQFQDLVFDEKLKEYIKITRQRINKMPDYIKQTIGEYRP